MTLRDGADDFEVTLLGEPSAERVVFFSVGSGGDPRRHAPLLAALADSGCSVVGPHLPRLASPRPTGQDLALRGRRLQMALEALAPDQRTVVGVGHSIGATLLLALAGGALWLGQNDCLRLPAIPRLDRLVLLAAPTDVFLPEGALDAVSAKVLAWAGTEDALTPPAQAEMLTRTLGHRSQVEVHVTPGIGHFSFMHLTPPHVDAPPDHDAFLEHMTAAVVAYACAP